MPQWQTLQYYTTLYNLYWDDGQNAEWKILRFDNVVNPDHGVCMFRLVDRWTQSFPEAATTPYMPDLYLDQEMVRNWMHGHLHDQRSLWMSKVRDTSEQDCRRHLPENTLNFIDDKELAGRCGTHVPIRWHTGATGR